MDTSKNFKECGIAFPFASGFFEVFWKETKTRRSARAFFSRVSWVRKSTLASAAKLSLVPPECLIPWISNLRGLLEGGTPLPPLNWDLFDLSGCTDFQKDVYKIIATIPHGETRTYGWVAQRLSKPAAGRAVGQALKANPFPLFVPCHRVVSVLSIGGFLGFQGPEDPEIQLKKVLLKLEEEFLSPVFSFLSGAQNQQSFDFAKNVHSGAHFSFQG